MYNDSNNINKRENNKAFAGLFLIALGGIYLLRQLDLFFFPTWLFSWPMILIIVGILSGIKHNFRRPFAYMMIFLGSIFLLAHIVSVSIYFFWPFIMIAIGLSMVIGKNKDWYRDRWERHMDGYHHDNRVDL
jgi:hypothetical protein